MEVIGYLKKQPKWQITVDENGDIQTGVKYGYKEAAPIKVPIFKATIRYVTFWKGRSSVQVKFEARNDNSEQGMIDEILGKQPARYSCTISKCMEIFQCMAQGKFDIKEDGWFTGTFTLSKQGTALSITPFLGNLEDEMPL